HDDVARAGGFSNFGFTSRPKETGSASRRDQNGCAQSRPEQIKRQVNFGGGSDTAPAQPPAGKAIGIALTGLAIEGRPIHEVVKSAGQDAPAFGLIIIYIDERVSGHDSSSDALMSRRREA